jgi:hypothetical protein
VTELLRNAEAVLATAQAAGFTAEAERFCLLVGHDGAVRVIAGREWSEAGLEAEYAPAVLYVVERTQAAVRVLGRARGARCLLECDRRRGPVRPLLPA